MTRASNTPSVLLAEQILENVDTHGDPDLYALAQEFVRQNTLLDACRKRNRDMREALLQVKDYFDRGGAWCDAEEARMLGIINHALRKSSR